MLPVIEAFMTAHRLPGITVVADAGMISEANKKAIEAAGLSRHEERQPRPGGEGPHAAQAEGLRHQPRRLPRRHAGHRGAADFHPFRMPQALTGR